MLTFELLDSLSDPGAPDRANEDCAGHSTTRAFVIDGATGLSAEGVMQDAPSDAAWLANRAAALLATSSEADLTKTLRTTIASLGREFFAAAGTRELPAWALPTSCVALLQAGKTYVDFAGLGDCTLHLSDANGTRSFTPMAGAAEEEAARARLHVSRMGGIGDKGSLLGDAATLAHLRELRALQNTGAGIWTFGLIEAAVDHLFLKRLKVAGPAHVLLCSDGFNALTDAYSAYTPEALVAAACEHGLAPLCEELRRIEREEDPKGLRFPRYKQSDDATALLLRIA